MFLSITHVLITSFSSILHDSLYLSLMVTVELKCTVTDAYVYQNVLLFFPHLHRKPIHVEYDPGMHVIILPF